MIYCRHQQEDWSPTSVSLVQTPRDVLLHSCSTFMSRFVSMLGSLILIRTSKYTYIAYQRKYRIYCIDEVRVGASYAYDVQVYCENLSRGRAHVQLVRKRSSTVVLAR